MSVDLETELKDTNVLKRELVSDVSYPIKETRLPIEIGYDAVNYSVFTNKNSKNINNIQFDIVSPSMEYLMDGCIKMECVVRVNTKWKTIASCVAHENPAGATDDEKYNNLKGPFWFETDALHPVCLSQTNIYGLSTIETNIGGSLKTFNAWDCIAPLSQYLDLSLPELSHSLFYPDNCLAYSDFGSRIDTQRSPFRKFLSQDGSYSMSSRITNLLRTFKVKDSGGTNVMFVADYYVSCPILIPEAGFTLKQKENLIPFVNTFYIKFMCNNRNASYLSGSKYDDLLYTDYTLSLTDPSDNGSWGSGTTLANIQDDRDKWLITSGLSDAQVSVHFYKPKVSLYSAGVDKVYLNTFKTSNVHTEGGAFSGNSISRSLRIQSIPVQPKHIYLYNECNRKDNHVQPVHFANFSKLNLQFNGVEQTVGSLSASALIDTLSKGNNVNKRLLSRCGTVYRIDCANDIGIGNTVVGQLINSNSSLFVNGVVNPLENNVTNAQYEIKCLLVHPQLLEIHGNSTHIVYDYVATADELDMSALPSYIKSARGAHYLSAGYLSAGYLSGGSFWDWIKGAAKTVYSNVIKPVGKAILGAPGKTLDAVVSATRGDFNPALNIVKSAVSGSGVHRKKKSVKSLRKKGGNIDQTNFFY